MRLLDAIGGSWPDWFDVNAEETEVTCKDPHKIFYGDCSSEVGDKWAASLKPHSVQTMKSPLTYEAWRDIPSSYIFCTEDQAIPIQGQKFMVEQLAQGVNVKTITLESSHSPFLSMPEKLAQSILSVI